jgi:hypothetical protein
MNRLLRVIFILGTLLVSILVGNVTPVLFAQDEKPYVLKNRNDLFLELMGPGGSGSINYNRNIFQSMSVRAGVGTIESDIYTPILVNKIFVSNKRSWFEVGTGPILDWGKDSHQVDYLLWTASVYWCHKLEDVNVYYRIGLCPIMGKDIPNGFLAWAGAGLGFRF